VKKKDGSFEAQKKESKTLSISRRAFLQGTALAGAGVLASRGVLFSDWIPPAGGKIREGAEEKLVATSCLNCSAGCAIQVRVVNGKAVSIRGNPLSKASGGKTCPRAFVALQVLYDPSRVQTPLKRTNPEKARDLDPRWVPISWDQALEEISARLKSIREQRRVHQLLLLYGLNTVSDIDLIHRLAEAFGTPNLISGEGLENEAEKAGRWLADGNYHSIAYDLERAYYILAFGASILESHKPLARNLRLWGKVRRERAIRARIVVIDPRYSVTASKADEWVPIYPGTDGALAMAIAHIILREQLYDKDFVRNWTTGFAEFAELAIRQYPPEKVAGITGISIEQIQRIAREFAQTKPAIAWVGTGPSRWPNGSYNAYAIFCLNALVGSIDAPGGVLYQENPSYQDMPKGSQDRIAQKGLEQARLDLGQTEKFPAAEVVTNQVADSIRQGVPYPVEVALGWNCNFNMSAPAAGRWDAAMKKLPYYVHVAPFRSEMAGYADILLPASTFLEQWAYDGLPGSGFAEVRIKQPVVKPLPHGKAIADIVFELARRQGGTISRSFTGIGSDAQGFVKYRTATLMPWEEFCAQGVFVGPEYQYRKYGQIFHTPSKKWEFCSGNLKNLLHRKGKNGGDRLGYLPHYEGPQFLGDPEKYPLFLVTYQPLLTIENGSQNAPWAQEIFLVMHGTGWTNFVEINSQTARGLRIRDGDRVWVESLFNRIQGRARVFEGIHPYVVGIARGQGHYAGGRWAEGMGVNPHEVIGVDYDRLSGQAAFGNTRVKVYKA
jgi:anaerobic selenocysteine-containing dehydrogenase